MKKSWKKASAIFMAAALAAGLAGCGASNNNNTATTAAGKSAAESKVNGENSPEADSKKTDVTVILDYVANTNHTGMYVALDKGYYEEAGLNVNIVEPTEGATATLVAVGKGDFGISYQEDVTVALASKDALPIKAIAAIIQHNTSGFVTYADKDIHSPKDFEGKTYAGWGGPGEEAVLKAVMTQAGADPSKLNRIISDGSGFEALKDKVDIEWFFEGWDNVKSFLAATEKGYKYAIENPDESAQILHKYAPDYSMDLLKTSQEYLAGKYMEDTDRWGEMKDSVWDNYTDFMTEYGVIDHAIPAADCYTNEFLPE